MSDYIVTDAELTETADAIRAKTGDSSLIEWESGTGFADVVAAIPSGGGSRVASGEFTLANNSNNIEITHNLGTQNVLIIGQRVNSDHSAIVSVDSRYVSTAFFAVPHQIDNAYIWDTTQEYQYTASGDPSKITYTASTEAFLSGVRAYFPAASDPSGMLTAWGYMGNSARGIIQSTTNSATVNLNYQFCAGRWVWKAYALG